VTQNLTPTAGLATLARLLESDFATAHLFTTTQAVEWRAGARRLAVRAPVHDKVETGHDRPKQRLVDPQAAWLRALRPTPDKVRQIQKFVELLAPLVADAAVPPGKELRVVDMGCGKGYLTFAAYDWLRANGWPAASVTGVEARPALVDAANRLACAHGFTGLRFEAGDIAGYLAVKGIDVLIALHACDTATDDALARGVAAGARLLIVSPCCHKELRPQLEPPAVLAGALRHGILREREAEFVTDALRAGLLEWAGYDARVFEFVSTEHTAKNLMIAAVKRRQPWSRADAAQRVRVLAAFYGIKQQRLAAALEFPWDAA
jgi:SAM-dependent methyltransferase